MDGEGREAASPACHIDWADVDRELLASIFAQLPFRLMGVVSLVCRRWALVAADPHWKPELVVYAWGEAHVTGLEQACARPTLLDFSLQQPVVQIACANEATLALTASGDVWCWGVCCSKPSAPDRQLETCAQPRRVRGLRDVGQIACSSPGYYHSRAQHQFLYHCAAVGRDGSLFTWGNCDVGQLCAQPGSSGAALSAADDAFVAAQFAAHGHISWVKEPMRVCQFGPPAAGAAAAAAPVRRVLRAACGFHVTILHIETTRPLEFETAEREWRAARAALGLEDDEADDELAPPSPTDSAHSADFSDGALDRRAAALTARRGDDDDGDDDDDGGVDGDGWSEGSESAELMFEDELEAEMAFDAALHAAAGELDAEPDDDDADDVADDDADADELDDDDDHVRARAETAAERAAYAERALRVELRAAAPALLGGAAVWLGGEAGAGGRLVVPTRSRRPATWRALLEAGSLPAGAALLTPCGRQLTARGGRVLETRLTVESCGRWCGEMSHALAPERELEGVPLDSLAAGAFHCCAVSAAGQLFAFGDQKGRDISNGNLLGTKLIGALSRGVRPPRRVPIRAAVAEVRASTYCTVAVTRSGKVLSWGDSDGGALGHAGHRVHTPALLPALTPLRVRHVSSSYTNGAAVTDEGRVFVWGGQCWEGGIAARDADAGMPTEVKWGGVPSCYRCDAVSLAHRHGYLVFRKRRGAARARGAGAHA